MNMSNLKGNIKEVVKVNFVSKISSCKSCKNEPRY